MTNDVADTNPEESVPCFALSKNDSYVMSASGGKISLFNMMTFKVSFESGILICLSSSHSTSNSLLLASADNDNVYATTTCCNFSCLPPSRQQYYCYWNGWFHNSDIQCAGRWGMIYTVCGCLSALLILGSVYLILFFLMQVKSKLKGHSKRITGLAFSHVLNVLVSSGADAQVISPY